MPDKSTDAISETRGRLQNTLPGDPTNGYSRTPADLPPGMSNNTGIPPTNGIGGTAPKQTAGGQGSADPVDAWLITKSRAIYTASTDYMEANVTLAWERSLYHFRSEHGPGTPYGRSDWRRARTFRPKTRANVKAAEAGHAAAAFATADYLAVTAFDQTNPQQVMSAQICKNLVQHRLRTAPWKWFLTAQGAFQDTKVYGVCISHQYWQYRKVAQVVPAFDDSGLPIMSDDGKTPMGKKEFKVVMDMPVCDLMAPENFRFDPMCDWRNPAQSSPYIIGIFPMTVGDALQMMDDTDTKSGQPTWRRYAPQTLTATRKENADNRTRRAREGHHRIDPSLNQPVSEFTTVYAHLNIVREDGVDLAWWTMGCELVLTDPIPLTEMYPHLQPGERPFQIGFSTVEAHRNYPAGDVEQIAPLQEEINAVANQRLDNVRLALNKRYFVRRGSQIDLEALMRNVPGGGVMTNDPEKDVQVIQTPDVTASSYQEQDRLSMDLDELVGGFGQGTIQQAGRQVDRSGSMDQLQGAAGAVQDYGIKIFFDSWMEPVLRQFVKLEQMYETDEEILAVAAKKSNLWIHYGQDQVTDDLLAHDLIVCVDVGMGNTDPIKRVQKLTFGVGQVMQLPGMADRLKSTDIADEIFGALGYKDASRFFMDDTELAQYQKKNPPQPPPEIALKQQELKIKAKENDQRDHRETVKIGNDHTFNMASLEQAMHLGEEKIQHSTGVSIAKNRTVRDVAAATGANKIAEINMKRAHEAAKPPPKAPTPPGKSKGPPGA